MHMRSMGHVGTPRGTCERVSVAPLLFLKGRQFLYGPVVYSQGLPFPMQNPLVGAAVPNDNQWVPYGSCQSIWWPMGSLFGLPPNMWTNNFPQKQPFLIKANGLLTCVAILRGEPADKDPRPQCAPMGSTLGLPFHIWTSGLLIAAAFSFEGPLVGAAIPNKKQAPYEHQWAPHTDYHPLWRPAGSPSELPCFTWTSTRAAISWKEPTRRG